MGKNLGTFVRALLGCALLGAIAVGAWRVHDLPLFELDRNAVDEGTVGDDWDNVLLAGTGGDFQNSGVVPDPPPVSVFAGGGSKDLLDIPSWGHADGPVPDKDDIRDAFAAGYINSVEEGSNHVGDLILYFGADRFANSGSASIGFWFFQQPVSLAPNGTFQGVHEIGDLLILSEFTQGGSVSTVMIYEWVGSGGSDGTLDLVFSGADCASAAPDDLLCGTVNSQTVAAPWPFTPKTGAAGTFPPGSLFEGGINVSALVPDSCCFTGFLAETRSSASVSATLKDFVLGSLNTCGLRVTKTPSVTGVCAGEAQVDYAYEVCNDGARPLFVNLVDDAGTPGNPADDVDVDGGQGFTLEPGACQSFFRSATLVATGPPPFAVTDTVTATAQGYAAGGRVCTSSVVATAGATVTFYDCAIDVTAHCQDAPAPGQPITVTGTVCNSGQVAVHLTTLVDDRTGALACSGPDPLPPGGCCTFTTTYVPTSPSSTITVSATGEAVGGGTVVADASSATCQVDCAPAIQVSAACQDAPGPGQPIAFTGTVTNTGNAALSDVTVVDEHAGLVLGPISLAPSETALFSGFYVPTANPSGSLVTASGTVESVCALPPVSDTASSTCAVECAPAIEVTSACQAAPAPGQPIPFTGTVTNTGDANLTDVTVVDQHAGLLLGPIALAPDQSASFSGSYVPTANPSSSVVTASGTVESVCALPPVSDTASSTCAVDCAPAIEVTSACQAAPAPGQPISFTGTVTNTGNAGLSSVTVVDEHAGIVLGPIALAPNQSASFSGSYVPTTNPSSSLVTASGQPASICNLGLVSDTASSACGVTCAPAIEVTSACQAAPAPGQPISFTGTVTNTGNANLSNVTVLDEHAGIVLGPIALAPNQSASFSGSYVPTTNPSSSVVTASGQPASICNLGPVSDTASSTCAVACAPAIEVTSACQAAPAPGQPIPFTGTVTNTGNASLTNVTVVDEHAGIVLGPISLAPNQSAGFSGSYVPTTNPSASVVTASGQPASICNLGPVSDTASSTCAVTCTPAIDVTSACQNASGPDQPIAVSGTVRNAGNTNLTGVTVVDDRAGLLLGPISLAPNQSAGFSGSYLPTASPSSSVVTASGQPASICGLGPVSDTATSTCSVQCTPCLAVTNHCVNASDTGLPIAFSGTVRNCGNVPLTQVTVVDDRAGRLLGPITLAPNQSTSFSGSYLPTSTCGLPSTNRVTARGTPVGICSAGGEVFGTGSATCTHPCWPVQIFGACSPGFWRNTTHLWDSPTDPIAAAAGFTTTTSFNAFFSLTSQQSGFTDRFTMHDAVNASGGNARRLARFGVSTLLNAASGMETLFPPSAPGVAELIAAIRNAMINDVYEPLTTELSHIIDALPCLLE
ncbi:MAG: hypothetical protein L0323_23670 [Planctomycetes bacterium]|nr:hypothetical protein [Planctomycetota bacterium]